MGGVRRLLAVLLVTAVLASCAHGEQRPPGGPRRIPADISAWNAIPGFAHLRRFWERKDLAPAYQHMGDPVHAARLLSKLDAGKRIVSVAIGSSFVANQAGCFHPSMSALYDLGVLPNPHICEEARSASQTMHVRMPVARRMISPHYAWQNACHACHTSTGYLQRGLLQRTKTAFPVQLKVHALPCTERTHCRALIRLGLGAGKKEASATAVATWKQ
eukprot:363896-Chlamydomonas_euryale.AAC.3